MTEDDLTSALRDLPPDAKARARRILSLTDEWAEAWIIYHQYPDRTHLERLRLAIAERPRVAAQVQKFERLVRDLRTDGRIRTRIAEIQREGWTHQMSPDSLTDFGNIFPTATPKRSDSK